jgi:UDP-N-acetylglucosamine 2-epimerase (non-hydrolysing)
MSQPIILVIGTRPEGIKVLPVYFALKRAGIPVIICSTSQHQDLLADVYSVFAVQPDYQLDIMRPGQDLIYVTNQVLEKIKHIFSTLEPSLIVVQGDTTTTMAASLAAFYLQIPVAHIEAGLRTSSIKNPFPEELNRRIVSLIASLHFAPTALAVGNLLAERVTRTSIFYTGNTVVDALRIMREKIENNEVEIDVHLREMVENCRHAGQQIVAITAHRRESFNGGLANILAAVKEIAQSRSDIFFCYPYHPNPYVKNAIENAKIDSLGNVGLYEPFSYKDMVYLLLHADWIATDSGGICEEALSLGKRVLILRSETERMEGIWAGLAQLVGTEKSNIKEAMMIAADTFNNLQKKPYSLFGDGYAAEKIVEIIKQEYMQSRDQHISIFTESMKKPVI